ncbi:MAG: hypothetical protein P1U34_11395 [Coxiellaceae bacterium]|nr:hypothetical protein [Coxiellaceae bacterium]
MANRVGFRLQDVARRKQQVMVWKQAASRQRKKLTQTLFFQLSNKVRAKVVGIYGFSSQVQLSSISLTAILQLFIFCTLINKVKVKVK